MKNIPQPPDRMKRKLLTLLAGLPFLSACVPANVRAALEKAEAREKAYYDALSPEEKRLHDSLKKKFHGIYGLVLRIDATSIKRRVTLTNERGRYIASPGTLGPGGGANLTYTDNSMPIPKAVRAVWREGAGWDDVKKVWNEGTVIGDYTVLVAERIPDSILDYIRQNGGALRLKIRLKDDGIMIGWDVEKRVPKGSWCVKTPSETCFQIEYFMPGGDFQEGRPYYEKDENGQPVMKGLKGWYIDKDGRRIETDW